MNGKIIRVYVNDRIKEHVNKMSESEGLSESAWVRTLIMREIAEGELRRRLRKGEK